MKIRKNSRIAWGVSLITFGIFLFLRLYQEYLLPSKFMGIMLDFRNYPIWAGVIFLIFSKNKRSGLALLLVGTLLRLSYEIHYVQNITTEIWAALMIIIGILLIVQVYRSDADQDD